MISVKMSIGVVLNLNLLSCFVDNNPWALGIGKQEMSFSISMILRLFHGKMVNGVKEYLPFCFILYVGFCVFTALTVNTIRFYWGKLDGVM